MERVPMFFLFYKILKMKRITILLAFVFVVMWANAQTDANCFRVYLHDKADTPYSIERPQEFLSQRALDKRARFDIAITEEDFPVNPSYVAAIGQAVPELHVMATSRWLNTVTVWCPVPARMAEVSALAFVDSVKAVGYYESMERQLDTLPLPLSGQGEYLDDSFDGYGTGFGQIALHNGQLLHNEGYRGEGMLIAMLDAGWNAFDMMPFFDKLYENGQIWGTYNFVPGMDNVYLGHGHGTSCASIILSHIVGELDTLVGTAPNANMVFIRTEDPDFEQLVEEDFWVSGAELADSLGADVITSSLGYTDFDGQFDYSSCDGVTSVASLAATRAAHKGMVVCIAAGNDGANEWHKLSRPSDAQDVLCVGAVNADSVYAPFSSCGPSYDGRVKPDVASCGWDTYVVSTWAHPADSISGDYTYYYIYYGSGTSYATPCLAGLATCLWQALPELSSLELMQIIREAGHQYAMPDTLMGYGIPNIYQAWLDNNHVGVRESVGESHHYVVAPNPCTTEAVVCNPQNDDINVCIYDLSGRVMYAERGFSSDTERHISVEGWPCGVYFARVQNRGGGVEIVKIVRQ